MGILEDIVKAAGEIRKLPPHPVRIIVDTSMMQLIFDRIPIGRGRLGSIDGTPVVVDDTIGLSRGLIQYSDGTVEKFGNWPKNA